MAVGSAPRLPACPDESHPLARDVRSKLRTLINAGRTLFQCPFVGEIGLSVTPQRHQTDVVGTSGQVRVDTLTNLLLTSPRDHRVNQAIATPILEVRSRKSLRKQDALIVLLIGVKA